MTLPALERVRRGWRVTGAVQGVGFRPFVYRLARELGLGGYVRNESGCVRIEAEGPPALLHELALRVAREAPTAARLAKIEPIEGRLDTQGGRFEIVGSVTGAGGGALVPDQATCPNCRDEALASEGRRAGYAFTSCANCGPRYSIAAAEVFDRAATSMARFPLCPDCRREYEAPADRRFHAQTIACPLCGPKLIWREADGSIDANDPLRAAARAIRSGGAIALQGVGGFQLLADAADEAAVMRLRSIKRRDAKPFAVMYPSLERLKRDCRVSEAEVELLERPEAPIVLLTPKPGLAIAPAVCRECPSMGAFLPYSPLHWLLLRELDRPVIATSANVAGEPILTSTQEAAEAFGAKVDGMLCHDREILQPCDDSLARVIAGRAAPLRRARGYAPLPVSLTRPCRPVLALGGHLKTVVAIAVGRKATLSPHIGDLESISIRSAYEQEVERLLERNGFDPEVVACDLHPDYYSTRFAPRLGKPVVQLQHHEAHAAACAAENGLEGPYLGVAWDGTGYGRDGAIWGSEFFLAEGASFERVAHLRPFRLPGGEAAARDGRRCAAGLLQQVFGGDLGYYADLSDTERRVFVQQIERGLNAPWSTSAGRLFDAVAALAGVGRRSAFEGEAAMRLEGAAAGTEAPPYPAGIDERERLELDWRPLIEAICRDAQASTAADRIAARFHKVWRTGSWQWHAVWASTMWRSAAAYSRMRS